MYLSHTLILVFQFIQLASSDEPLSLNLNYVFAFGDSYTDVGFNVSSPLHPRPANYEGNPIPPGTSAAYANNYVEDICAEYNRSLIYLIDFAHSGAIVNSSLVSPYQSINNTFTAQVDNQFLPYLASKPDYAPWQSDDSLFIVFFGINDIDRALGNGYPLDTQWDAKLPLIMDTYWKYVEKLVAAGARNFAILNLPTYWRSPDVINRGQPNTTAVAKHRNLLYNSQLAARHDNFQRAYSEVRSWLVDVYGLWEDMYEEPAKYGLRNITEYCDAYYTGTGANLTAYNSSCTAPVSEYLWLNWLHPTWVVHRYLALLVLETIGYEPRV